MDLRYTWQKLYEAVFCLIGSSSIEQRLTHACGMLVFLNTNTKSVPEFIDEDFMKIMKEIDDAKPVANEGKIAAMISSKDEVGKNELAKQILSMYDQVTRYMQP